VRRAGEVRPALRIFSLAASLLIPLAGSIPVRAGHELPYYPSFYPHEIQLTVSDAGGAAEALRTGLTHATPGTDPFGGALPQQIAAAASWGGYVVLTFSREAIRSIAPPQRCALAAPPQAGEAGTVPLTCGFVRKPIEAAPLLEEVRRCLGLLVDLRRKPGTTQAGPRRAGPLKDEVYKPRRGRPSRTGGRTGRA